MIVTAFGETVTLHRRTVSGYDDLGAPVYASADVQVPDSVIVPETGAEASGASHTATGRLVWYAPPGTVVRPDDTVTVRGLVYEIDGWPLDFGTHAVTGARGRVQVALKRPT